MTTTYQRGGTERVGEKSKGTMWAIVQVEIVTTCVVGEAELNDFGCCCPRSYPSSSSLTKPTVCKISSGPLSFPLL